MNAAAPTKPANTNMAAPQTQNAVATTQPTRLDQFRMEILPPERRQELFSGMPPHVRPERFERNLVNALMQNTWLLQHDPRLIFREVSKAAALGLYLDPQLGEAYLIESWNGKTKRKEPQLRVGYRGLIKLGRQSGEISMIYAHEVNQEDFLDVDQGAEKKLVHKPKLFSDRGPVIGYYAVVKYKDGDFDFEPLSIPQAHKIRDRSDGWKAFAEGKIKSTPWATDEEEMAKKTVIRRLAKRIPQSPELSEALRIEDAAEHSELVRQPAITPPKPPKPPAPPSQQITPPKPIDNGQPIEDAEIIEDDAQVEEVSFVEHDEETGEIVEDSAQNEPQQQRRPVDPDLLLDRLDSDLRAATDAASIEAAWEENDIESALTHHEQADVYIGMARKFKERRLAAVRR